MNKLENVERFCRDDLPLLLECMHCVNPDYLTTEENNAKIRELVERGQVALDELKTLVN